jgi:hypothetical protein
LLYEQGFTINGARNRLEIVNSGSRERAVAASKKLTTGTLRTQLEEIRALLRRDS